MVRAGPRVAKAPGDALSRHRFASLVDPLRDHPSFVSKAMFGCVACYHGGRLVLLLADRGDPWSGILVPMERSEHASLMADVPALRPHPVLPKWLYLAHNSRGFAAVSGELVRLIAADDPRIGVEPQSPRLPRMRPVFSGPKRKAGAPARSDRKAPK
jgi:hypothetical protein